MMYSTLKPLILASNSPRRKQFLEEAGLDFEVNVAHIDEMVLAEEKPEIYVKRMAETKGRAVGIKARDKWIVAADTIVVIDGKILGKPDDIEDAVEMLLLLAGREHQVMTSFYLGNVVENVGMVQVVTTKVLFAGFSRQVAEGYVATGEPMDKAGAYGIQGIGGSLVESISGSYSNVVGLPMVELLQCLARQSIIKDG